MLLTYPFSDGTLAAMKGDYTNLHVTADLDMRNLAGNLGVPTAPPTGGEPGLPTCPSDAARRPEPARCPRRPTARAEPQLVLDQSGGGSVCVPGVTCLGSGQSRSSSDGWWRSLYSGGEA